MPYFWNNCVPSIFQYNTNGRTTIERTMYSALLCKAVLTIFILTINPVANQRQSNLKYSLIYMIKAIKSHLENEQSGEGDNAHWTTTLSCCSWCAIWYKTCWVIQLYSADTEQCLRFFLMMTLIYTLNKRQCHSTQCLPPASDIIKKYIIYNWKFKLDKFYN